MSDEKNRRKQNKSATIMISVDEKRTVFFIEIEIIIGIV